MKFTEKSLFQEPTRYHHFRHNNKVFLCVYNTFEN